MSLRDTRYLHDARGRGGEVGHLEFVNVCGEISGADVHLVCDIFRDDVDDELAGTADVAGGVFGDEVVVGAVSDPEADDGRVSTQIVVGAEGCRIEVAVLTHTSDQGYRTGRDQPDQ